MPQTHSPAPRPPHRGRPRARRRWPCSLLGPACLLLCLPPSPAQLATQPVPIASPQTLLKEQATGTVSGIVADTTGALVAGARVKLLNDTSSQETLSDSDGRYAFRSVPTGAFTLSVVLQGFVATSVQGNLLRNQNLDLQTPPLQLATAFFDVDVYLPPADVAEEQLHEQEKQRLAGFLPNFFVSYEWKTPPLSTKQKFSLAWKNARDPGNLLLVGTVAGVQQASDGFNGYGQGAAGYGRRFGADLGNLVSGTMLGGAVFPSLFHQDPRYFYKGTGSIRSRALYALSSAVVCRGDNGHRQPAFAGVLGDLSAGALSNLYYPASDRHDLGLTIENGFLGVAGDALNGLFQEFFSRMLTPDKPDRKSAKNSQPRR